MQAYKLEAIVPPDHQLSITLPDSFPAGEAEIIILAKVEAPPIKQEAHADALDDLLAWQQTLPSRSVSPEEVEARIQAERDAWND